ncbi:Exocyst complex subunit Sec8 [Phaffia rhodozyma]|uniref:Exocyst complex component Sec8 n=1 Tax=Phaffia rhodozyma TaxID=264483 RepID=A0A0F7SLQ0_PHARH|nr:Exocyst complex subunit Sec8 [Phaffia rhodozyma]
MSRDRLRPTNSSTVQPPAMSSGSTTNFLNQPNESRYPTSSSSTIPQSAVGSTSFVLPAPNGSATPQRPTRSAARRPVNPPPSSIFTSTSTVSAATGAASASSSSFSSSLAQQSSQVSLPVTSSSRDSVPLPTSLADSNHSTWEEERRERARAQQVSGSAIEHDQAYFKTALIGKAFANSGKDRRLKDLRTEDRTQERRVAHAEEDLGGEFSGIDQILREIKQEWSMVTEPDFNPIPLSLNLLSDTSSERLGSFQNLADALLDSLQSTVHSHSSSFASALSTHNTFLHKLTQAQKEVRDAKNSLLESKESLRGERNAEIGALWSRGRVVRDTLSLLDVIDHLKSIPDQFETLLIEKRLLLAALVLVRSLKQINKPEMLEIGALSDLRSYLVSQETALQEILVEELHNHLYLKSYYCDSRWSSYTKGQTELPDLDILDPSPSRFATNSKPNPSPSTFAGPSPTSHNPAPKYLTRFLQDLPFRLAHDPSLNLPDDFTSQTLSTMLATPLMRSPGPTTVLNGGLLGAGLNLTDKMVNPEVDSFMYIEHLLEALAALGKLRWAMDVLAQREASELFALVEGTIQEVEERSLDRKRQTLTGLIPMNSLLPPPPSSEPSLMVDPTDPDGLRGAIDGEGAQGKGAAKKRETDENGETLRDLFWSVFSKFDAVLQGLRVVWEVTSAIEVRKDFKDDAGPLPKGALAGDILELWKPVQAEIKIMIREYLSNKGAGSSSIRHPIASVNDVLRNGGGKTQRNKSKSVYRFIDSDSKVTKRLLKPHEDELQRALQSSVPGLVNLNDPSAVVNVNASTSAGPSGTLRGAGAYDDVLSGSTAVHRLLVPPDVNNVSVLFQPTLVFLGRAAGIIPVPLQDETLGLDEFVRKAYDPAWREGS